MVKLFLNNLWVLLVLLTVGLNAQSTISGTISDGDNDNNTGTVALLTINYIFYKFIIPFLVNISALLYRIL